MAITDELRKWIDRYTMREYAYNELTKIADHIDAKYEEALGSKVAMAISVGEDGTEFVSMPAKELSEHYVELPKDADGEYIHIGDVMEDGLDEAFTPKKVKMLMLEDNEWMLNFGGGWCVMKHHEWRHHTPDTWERIIRDAVMRGADIQWRAEGGGRMTDYFVPEGYDLVDRCKALAGGDGE